MERSKAERRDHLDPLDAWVDEFVPDGLARARGLEVRQILGLAVVGFDRLRRLAEDGLGRVRAKGVEPGRVT